jgi:septum formation protein
MYFFEKLKHYDIILGSKSPRRKALLKETGIPFRVMVKETDESFPENLSPIEIVTLLSKNKSKAFQEEVSTPGVIVITADTIVVNDGVILNKSSNIEEAREMLKSLSGRSHKVYTGVSICSKDKSIHFHDKTTVSFKILDEEEIDYYIKEYKPFDKAGSYGIQEWLGIIGIEGINGSYDNVVGLPVQKVYSAIKEIVMAKI